MNVFTSNLLKNLTLFFSLHFISFQAIAWNAPSISSPAADATVFVGINLNWNSVVGSQAYQLQVDTSSTFNSPLFYTVTKAYINSVSSNSDTQDNPPNLRFGQRYYWRVRAYISGDTSAWTSSTFITNDFVAQTSPNATDTWTGTTINWQVHTGVSFYDMQADTTNTFNSPALRSVSNAYINSTDGNNDTQTFLTDLYFGKTYYWRVRARNAVDTSSWSTIWTFTTRDYVNQTAPNATDTWTGTTINWQVHTGVSFYDMQADTTNTFNSPALRSVSNAYINSTDGNNDTQSFLSDLYFGKTYYWRVRARNAVDTSVWSPVWTFTTRDYVNQTSPNATDTWTGTTINWQVHTGVSFYDMQADTSATFNSPALRSVSNAYINSTDGNNDTQSFLSDLYFGKTYYWRVRARNAVDTSVWSPVWSFTTRDFVSLSNPADAALNISLTPTLNWAPHNGIVKYQLELDASNLFNTGAYVSFDKAFINSTDGNSDTQQGITGLSANTIYFWRVRAINNVDTSSWTERWFSTGNAPLVLPAAPSTVAPTCGASNIPANSVTLSWNAVTGADFYQLEYSNAGFNGQPDFTNILNTSLNISNLLEGNNYCWRVRAVDNGNAGTWSSLCCFSTASAVAIAAPTLEENEVCAGNALNIGYSTTGTFIQGNQFTVELSNAQGNFTNPTVLGTFTQAGSGNLSVDVPDGLSGNGFKIRIISSAPAFTSAASANITINALPTVSVELDAQVCAQLSAYDLPEGSPSGGTWSGTATSQNVFNPQQSGTGVFELVYSFTDVNGCTNSANGTIQVDGCIGLEPQTQISVKPGMLMLEGNTADASYTIIDLAGRQVANGRLDATNTIATQQLNPGIYLLQIEQNSRNQSFKFLVP